MKISYPLSLFDCLSDEIDHVSPSKNRHEQEREVYGQLIRDLEGMLNTRKISDLIDDMPKLLSDSLLNYGMSDFSIYNLSDKADLEQLTLTIEETIRRFETKFHEVKVSVIDHPDRANNEIHLSIYVKIKSNDGVGAADPIIINSVIQSNSCHFSIKGVENEE